jgi:small GTP-binding protein
MAATQPYDVTDFPPPGQYYCNLPEFTVSQFATLSPSHDTPKTIFVGDPGVGKTCLVNQMRTRTFQGNYNPTIGVAYLQVPCTINGNATDLAIWDTPGGQAPNALTRSFYRGAAAAFVCFDLSKRPSFNNLGQWCDAVTKNCPEAICRFLIGCKCDLSAVINDDEIRAFCELHNLEFWATSAKTAAHVSDLVKRLCVVALALNVFRAEKEAIPPTVNLERRKDEGLVARKKCC